MSDDGHSFGPIESVDRWRAFVAAFDDRTLPKSFWTHKAHLTVGLWYLLHHPPGKAWELLRGGISTYNRAIGIANTDTEGYHETLTRFYVLALADFVSRFDGDGPSIMLLNELLASKEFADLRWPLKFYSRDRINSIEARKSWVAPDLNPFPWSIET